MTKTIKFFISIFLLLSFNLTPTSAAWADESFNLLDSLGGAEDDILEPDDAFKISYDSQPGQFKVNWVIADGHYLYREKMQITTDETSINSKPLVMPQGDAKDDPIFNKTLYVFHNFVDATLPYQYTDSGDKEVTFKVKYQGCSEISGICYPPQTKKFTVKLSPISEAQAAAADISSSEPVSEQDEIANALRSGNTWLTLIIFFGAGLLLAFTPCVFPMIPILSGIIVGQGEDITTRKALAISSCSETGSELLMSAAAACASEIGDNLTVNFLVCGG